MHNYGGMVVFGLEFYACLCYLISIINSMAPNAIRD